MYLNYFVVGALLFCKCFIKASLIVQTKNGLVMGREAQTVPGNKTYHAFQGIPFAQPPIGELRFASPLPAKNWSGTLNTTEDGNICPQSFTQGSEDCLFINVYTTNLDPTKKLPVMVWIYGGAFVKGDSTYARYGPDYLLEEDVIVVTFNYRLGIFGFLSTGDSSCSGNWGFKDQILALKWIQDNIANFGGDDKLVTLFGHSAGSTSISYLCQTNLTKGLFHKVIMESGTSLDIWALNRTPRTSAFAIGRLLGILTTNSTELVRQLRQVDATELNTIVTNKTLNEFTSNPLHGIYFGPCIEPSGESAVVLEKSHQLLQNGGFHKIPYIIGFNSQESLYFRDIIRLINMYLLANGLYPTRLIPLDINTNLNAFSKGTLALGIKRHYFGLLLLTLSQEAIAQYFTDVAFVNGIHETIRLTSKSAKVYCYRFSYEGGPLGNSSQRSEPGVAHKEEVFYLWREQNSTTYVPTASDLLTRQRLVKSWTNFAKTSNPTPTLDPVFENVTWTATSSQNVNCLDVGNDLAMENNFSQYSITYWNDVYATWGNPPFDTY